MEGSGVNYPALTDGALGFPVVFSAHLHLPFRVFTYPRPVPLVKARAMLVDGTWVTYPTSAVREHPQTVLILFIFILNSPPSRTGSLVLKDEIPISYNLSVLIGVIPNVCAISSGDNISTLIFDELTPATSMILLSNANKSNTTSLCASLSLAIISS